MSSSSRLFIKKALVFIPLVIGVMSVFYYSWLPDSNLKSESYLPQWILSWSNEYINLRTAVPFVCIGFLIELWTSSFSSSPKKQAPFRLKIIGFAAAIVCLAEGGQFFIKDRHPDIMDVVFGIAGSVVGVALYGGIRVLIRPTAKKKRL